MGRPTAPSADVVRLVRDRDLWVCARCGLGWKPLSTQHRIARRMGGTRDPRINRPANLITLCGTGTTGCHGWVEAHPAQALELGYKVPPWQDPATVAVFTWRGWVQLCSDGDLLHIEETVPGPT